MSEQMANLAKINYGTFGLLRVPNSELNDQKDLKTKTQPIKSLKIKVVIILIGQ